MCGIVGYIGKKEAAPKLVGGLKRLEYRGYDSAGIAVLQGGKITAVKEKGRVGALKVPPMAGTVGIGHTRWATHGAPSARNAHPHLFGKFAVVHNGIIENYLPLKEECLARGEKFLSDTDSETIAHLLEFYDEGNLLETVRKTVSRLKGSFALAILCSREDCIVAVRQKSPLIIGTGKEGVYAASDIPALAGECDKIYPLEDGEIAILGRGAPRFYGETAELSKKAVPLDLHAEIPALGGYTHFMRKEMGEIPTAIRNSLVDFASESRFLALYEVLCQTYYIHIVACGTAYHSGIAAKYAIERLARVPVEVVVSSEYRYRDPILDGHTLVVAVSQSGETADTLAAAELARRKGAKVLAVTNAPRSSLTRIADFVLETEAGREIAVAATKSFNAQLAALYSLAVALAQKKGKEAEFAPLRLFPALSEEVLGGIERLRPLAAEVAKARSVFFLGRGADYCAALEGSLKLKEISYLPSEGYPAGELKHGTLALIERGTPVVAIITGSELAEKTMNAVSEVYARGAKVFLVSSIPSLAEREGVSGCFLLPKCEELFSPLISVIPLQALAYYTALARGNDPDKPRNLAKSVTVE